MINLIREGRFLLSFLAAIGGSVVHAQVQLVNASFETPARAFGSYANPADAIWTFSGASGVYSDAGQTLAGLHGVQVAYLSGAATAASRGRISQTVSFATPGLYQLRFLAGGTGSVSVSVGGTIIDTVRVRPSFPDTESLWTQPFSIGTAGGYEVALAQESSVSADRAAVDNIVVVASPAAFTNGSFEQFNGSGVPTGWTVTSAIARAATASETVAGAALLAFSANGTATSTVTVPAAGVYSVSLRQIGTSTCGVAIADVTGGGNTALATLPFVSRSGGQSGARTSSSFSLPSGARTLRFSSSCANRIDSVVLNRAGPSFGNADFETPTLLPPVNSFDVPWQSAPAGATWAFSGADAGIQATPGVEAVSVKAEVGLQFGRVRVAGQSISQTVTLDPGVYQIVAQVAQGNLRIRINGTLLSTVIKAGSLTLVERSSDPFTVSQLGAYTISFEPDSAGMFAIDLPRIIKIAELTAPSTTLALRVNGSLAPATVPPGGTLEATATATDADGLQRIRVLRNGVALAPESTAVFPASATSPLTVTVSPLMVGNYTFTAEATDHKGVVGIASQTLAVNTPPSVTLGSPTASQVIRSLPITLQASASDADSNQTITKIEFYQVANSVTTKLGEVLNPVGTATLGNAYLAPGSIQLFARAFDSAGGQTDSAPTSVTVTGLFNGGFERPGGACSGTSCTSGQSGVYWQFVNSIDSQPTSNSAIINNSSASPRCVIPAPEGANAARLLSDSIAPGYFPPRLFQRLYLLQGVYDFSMKASRVAPSAHSLKVTLGTLTPLTFPLTTAYQTYTSAAPGLTIPTSGFYDLSIDSTNNFSGSYACVDDVRLVARNKKPTVSSFVANPTGIVNEPAPPITLSATATDPDAEGYIARIEFLIDGASQTPPLQCVNNATAPARPFSCDQTWLGGQPGRTHVFTVKAVDDRGEEPTATSPTASVTVNRSPIVSFIYPTPFLAVPQPPVGLKVSVTDPENDAIQYVDFSHVADGLFIGRVVRNQAAAGGQPAQTGSEYQFNADLDPGQYVIQAVATDARGAVTVSPAIIDFRLNAQNQAPTVFLTGASGEYVYGTVQQTYSVSSHDYDGNVVDAWITVNGTSYLCRNLAGGGITHCSYAFGSNTPVNRYTITAAARDNSGRVGWARQPESYWLNVTPRPITCNLSSTQPNGGVTVDADNRLVVLCTDTNGNPVDSYTVIWTASATCSDSVINATSEIASCTVRPTSTAQVTYSAQVNTANNEVVGGTLDLTVTPAVNLPPTITLIAPGSETVIAAPATFNVTVNPVDPEGAIKRVELLRIDSPTTSTVLATRTAPPWTFTWASVPVGQYTLKARVYDALDATATVDIPRLISNALPTVSITGVANNAAFGVGNTATFTATASDTDGTIASVEYFVNGQSKFVATAAPYTFAWTNLPNGDHVIVARATDNRNMQGLPSAPVTIKVNSAPTITLDRPRNNEYIAAGPGGAQVVVNLSATDVNDPDGILSVNFQVSFGRNTTNWRQVTPVSGSAPNYAATYIRAPQDGAFGDLDYSVRACARDPRGAERCTTPINITIAQNPYLDCDLDLPNATASFTANQLVNLTAQCYVNGALAPVSGFNFDWQRSDGSGVFTTATGAGNCSTTPSLGTVATCQARVPTPTPENFAYFRARITGNNFSLAETNTIRVTVGGGLNNNAPSISNFALTSGSSPLTVTPGASVSFNYTVFDSDASQTLQVRVRDANGLGNVLAANNSVAGGGTRSGTLTWTINATSAATNVVKLEVSDGFGSVLSTNAITVNVTGGSAGSIKLIFIHPDVKGSPLMATDANGVAQWREDYSAFGVRRKNEAAANSGTNANSLWYIGKPQDNVTGLVYFGARWYDPQVGRFMGFDPAGVDEDNPHSFNRYAYGNNNPYKYLDPDGRSPIVATGGSAMRAAAPAAGIGDSVRGGGLPQLDPARGIMTYPADGPRMPTLEGYLQAAQTVHVLISPIAASQKLADMIVTAVMRGTGSYTIDFDNGQRYHGKGGEERMRRSVTEKEKEHGCKAASCDWKSAPNNREAFKAEAQRIRNDRGVQNPGNYNKINSPGEKYLEQDSQQDGQQGGN